ncbi:shikimate kinase [Streptococcus sp. zg-86]|uniref:Shikimate kinase n=1 Tax=Streptococcus zhangguiae TaxID=2664091 RepID=A0A6I4R8W5_9STRE|nr:MULTISPECIES: shikimate kinase [unclassified Streptococcus]MTB64249.1 shikimate kinase [Streptococcus sp. zg-86]MTB90425.1 shikimate kinase [Streptococcus sp. zg-36]MWV56236.1 shikimate kinase [Streptococcus sp. zg-70]QTH48142.1 shikimate kinase [Streptococcus sp. zg-86]
MNLVIIGAQASGKMTIGQEIEKLTKMTLFHNHDSIDFVMRFMEYGSAATELIQKIRMDFFEVFAKNTHSLIFTVVINFNDSHDLDFLKQIQDVFHSYKREVLFVELETDIEERLRRNRTEHRMQCKPLKRDVEWSEQDILSTMDFAQFNPESSPEFLKHYYKINNTNLSAYESAQLILQKLKDIETI